MKIGIITFHASHNYGSMLQAYALQTFLVQMGHEVEIINYRQKKQKLQYARPLNLETFGNLKRSIRLLLSSIFEIPDLYRKWHRFEDFMNGYMNLTKEYSTESELQECSKKYDVVITGSDQIWNTKVKDFSEAYFASFVGKGVKKIAYAPSMGPEPESECLNVDYLKNRLYSYDYIAVREGRAQNFLIDNNIEKKVDLVLDPTMLLDKSSYEMLIPPQPIIEEPYLFYYTPGGHLNLFEQTQTIAEEYDLPIVVSTYNSKLSKVKNSRVRSVLNVGPLDFLNLVKNASVVCGASYHLMVFSVIFEKNFYCINGDKDSRLNTFLKLIDLEDRIVSIRQSGKVITKTPIDYKKVCIKLHDAKKRSMEFLENSLR